MPKQQPTSVITVQQPKKKGLLQTIAGAIGGPLDMLAPGAGTGLNILAGNTNPISGAVGMGTQIFGGGGPGDGGGIVDDFSANNPFSNPYNFEPDMGYTDVRDEAAHVFGGSEEKDYAEAPEAEWQDQGDYEYGAGAELEDPLSPEEQQAIDEWLQQIAATNPEFAAAVEANPELAADLIKQVRRLGYG